MREDRDYYIYRAYDAGGLLLYLGISSSPTKRQEYHSKHSEWFRWLARFEAEATICGSTWATAHAREVAAIEVERPLYNRMHRGIVTWRPHQSVLDYELAHGYIRRRYRTSI